MATTECGLDDLCKNVEQQDLLKGRVGYLCHAASVNSDLQHGAMLLSRFLGKRLVCLIGPQHGFACDVQDNMVETPDQHSTWIKIPIFSLYGKNRAPSPELVQSIDTLVVDLQDVGTRVYTYITTLALCIDAFSQEGKRIVVLDRPNPAGPLVEGCILNDQWRSFVGHHPIPQRHGLTMGEVAKLHCKIFAPQCDLHVIKMVNYRRDHAWPNNYLPWINPSPNLATPNAALCFPGTVLFEGTSVSEGRGTTRSLEVVGAPGVEPFEFCRQVTNDFANYQIEGVVLRALHFVPMFGKYQNTPCGGVHIHVLNSSKARTWRLGQLLIKHFRDTLGNKFDWNRNPYEYEFKRLAIDLINGGPDLRHWVESNGTAEELLQLESDGLSEYLNLRKASLLYP